MPDELLRKADEEQTLASLLDVPFRFRRRPIPLAADERLAYRVTVLLLLLRLCSRNDRSSLKRLHFLDWAVRARARAQAIRRMKDLTDLGHRAVRYDPLVDAALRFAAAERLVSFGGGRIVLQDRGEAYLDAIVRDEKLLASERATMELLAKHIPEAWFK